MPYVTIFVKACRGLRDVARMGSNDPYVSLQFLGRTLRTKTADDATNPTFDDQCVEWNFSGVEDHPDAKVHVLVRHEGVAGSTNIGRIAIDVTEFAEGVTDKWYNITEGSAITGQIQLSGRIADMAESYRVHWENPVPHAWVFCHKAEGLKDKSTFYAQRPFCKVQILGTKQQTGPAGNSETSPDWAGCCLRFPLPNSYASRGEDKVHIAVDAAGKISVLHLGNCELPLALLFKGFENRWLPLSDGGKILLSGRINDFPKRQREEAEARAAAEAAAAQAAAEEEARRKAEQEAEEEAKRREEELAAQEAAAAAAAAAAAEAERARLAAELEALRRKHEEMQQAERQRQEAARKEEEARRAAEAARVKAVEDARAAALAAQQALAAQEAKQQEEARRREEEMRRVVESMQVVSINDGSNGRKVEEGGSYGAGDAGEAPRGKFPPHPTWLTKWLNGGQLSDKENQDLTVNISGPNDSAAGANAAIQALTSQNYVRYFAGDWTGANSSAGWRYNIGIVLRPVAPGTPGWPDRVPEGYSRFVEGYISWCLLDAPRSRSDYGTYAKRFGETAIEVVAGMVSDRTDSEPQRFYLHGYQVLDSGFQRHKALLIAAAEYYMKFDRDGRRLTGRNRGWDNSWEDKYVIEPTAEDATRRFM